MQRSDVHTVDSKLSDGSSATGKPPVATLHREHVHRLDDVKELEALHDSAITAEDIEFLEAFQADGRAKKLMRKVDVRVLPILIFLYLIAFVGARFSSDRVAAAVLTLPNQTVPTSGSCSLCARLCFGHLTCRISTATQRSRVSWRISISLAPVRLICCVRCAHTADLNNGRIQLGAYCVLLCVGGALPCVRGGKS